MSNCITTYTGKHFDSTQPEKERICIDDIAHALSLLCRGNGHVKTFFFRRTALYPLCKGSHGPWLAKTSCTGSSSS